MATLHRRTGTIRDEIVGEVYEFVRKYSRSTKSEGTNFGSILGSNFDRRSLTPEVLFSGEPPQPVAEFPEAGNTGVASDAAHQHEGLHSASKLGSPQILGDMTFTSSGLEISQSGHNLHFSADITAGVKRIVEYKQVLSLSSILHTLFYIPVGDVAVYLNGLRKLKGLHYSQGERTINFNLMMASHLDFELIVFEYLYREDDAS